jgi:histidyl-tRNA synthetase
MELQLPRGMRDFPPEEKILRDEVIALLKDVFERYGFSPLETPIVERWEILAAKYAGGEEILKEAFRLRDQGGRQLGLRYDHTVPLARFVGMNPTLKRPFKRYAIGQIYRDGPIKQGRTREFYQCDVDTVGVHSAVSDAEFILMALEVFDRLDFQIEVRVNHRQLLNDLAAEAGVPESVRDSAILTLDKVEKIGREAVRKELIQKRIPSECADRWLNLLSVSGSNDEVLQVIRSEIPSSRGLAELMELFECLPKREGIRFVPSLARGLSYYTGVLFEVKSLDPPLEGSVAGGGRWDDMIGDFWGSTEKYPAVGISFGLEPIFELYKTTRTTRRKTVTEIYVIPIGLKREGLEIAQKLRAAGLKVDLDLAGKGISDNLRYANAYGIPYALLVGQEELKQNKVKLRDMKSGEEELLTLEQAIAKLASNN